MLVLPLEEHGDDQYCSVTCPSRYLTAVARMATAEDVGVTQHGQGQEL